MSKNSIYDIREDEIDIDGKAWDDEEVQKLCYKSLYVTQRMVDYWQPYIKRGEDLFDKYDGKILGDMQRATYQEVEDKFIIEPPIMKSPIRSLLGQIINARKSGEISTEDGTIDDPNESANEVASMNIVLKDLEKKSKEQLKIRDAIHDSLVSCYPNALMWKKRSPDYDNQLKYDLEHLAWNSAVYGPMNLKQPDMSDVKEIVYFDSRSMADLIENYPDKKEQIEKHWGSKKPDEQMIASILHWDATETIEDVSYLKGIINMADGETKGSSGLLPTFMRLFPVKNKEDVWVKVTDDEEGDIHCILPDNWSDTRKKAWEKENKDKYDGPFEKETIILWMTVFTATGLVLANEKHWYQEGGKLPATIVVPCMLNGRPSGPSVDMSDEVLRNCIAQIEYLDDMRKGNGMLMVTREGSFANIADIPEEACKSFGIGLLKKDFMGSVGDAFATVQRSPSQAWRDYGEFTKQGMIENTRINEAMQGQSAPRQANVAKTTEIQQAMVTNAIYVDNFNSQIENHQNVKLSMVPYVYDDTMIVVTGYDEKDQTEKTQVLNQPEYDENGEVSNVVNDVTSRHYRWKISPVDDSPTAKAAMMNEALGIMNSAAGPLLSGDPSGEFFASFLAALDNQVLNKTGKNLLEKSKQRSEQAAQLEQQKVQQDGQAQMMKAQAELEKIKKSGVTLSFTGEQIMQYPALYSIYQQTVSGAPAGQPPMMPPPQPQMPPQGGMPEMPMGEMAEQPMMA